MVTFQSLFVYWRPVTSTTKMEGEMDSAFAEILYLEKAMTEYLAAIEKCYKEIRTANERANVNPYVIPGETSCPKRRRTDITVPASTNTVDLNNNTSEASPESEVKASVKAEEPKRKVPIKTNGGKAYKLSPDPAQTVTASFHQKSARRGLSKLRGSQCTSISLAAILISRNLPVDKWRSQELDAILQYGDRLHVGLVSTAVRNTTDPRLALHEIPTGRDFKYAVPIPTMGDKWFGKDYPLHRTTTLSKSEEFFGQVHKVRQTCPTAECDDLGDTALDKAVEKVLREDYDGAVITVGKVSGALIKDSDGRIRYFDSHCNNKIGRLTLEGTAVLLTFDTAQEFARYIRKRESNPYCCYELVGIRQN